MCQGAEMLIYTYFKIKEKEEYEKIEEEINLFFSDFEKKVIEDFYMKKIP